MFHILQNVNVDWLKYRRAFILISVAIMLGGLASALARQLTPAAVPQPPQAEGPREPWSYGVLGPDRE